MNIKIAETKFQIKSKTVIFNEIVFINGTIKRFFPMGFVEENGKVKIIPKKKI